MKVGFVGWRGMVGSVLMQRMQEEQDFNIIKEPFFFSTSNSGALAPDFNQAAKTLLDANNIEELSQMDIILTCQGGDYTKSIFPKLISSGWNGYWIDASSALRMDQDAIIVLDPVNRELIDKAIEKNTKKFIGGNCTVSLMLMALHGLFRENLVDWVSSMTYQSASGAGAKNMREMVSQMGAIHHHASDLLHNTHSPILDLDKNISDFIASADYPKDNFSVPLAGSLIPWIDADLGNGQSKEEWKGSAETNKILGLDAGHIPIDGLCIRVGVMRCHSQALTIKLKEDIPLERIEDILSKANQWVKVIPNSKEKSIQELTPTAVTGKLEVPIGRIKKMDYGQRQFISAFTVGDQLLWGAAEPLRRILKIILEKQQQ